MTTTTPKLNVKLLEQVKQAILDEPKRINMDSWSIHPEALPKNKRPACNTVGCIAGWAFNISKKLKPGKLFTISDWGIRSAAIDALGLTDEQRQALFYTETWYDGWGERLKGLNPGTKAYAKIVAAYIDYFIAKETANAKTQA